MKFVCVRCCPCGRRCCSPRPAVRINRWFVRPRGGRYRQSGHDARELADRVVRDRRHRLYPLLNVWAPAYNAKYPNVTITTEDTGSGAGISQAVAGAVNIGASGAYLSNSEMAAHQGLMNIALKISALLVNYNLPGVNEHLKLNGKVLAAMYRAPSRPGTTRRSPH